jgi:predicted transcriptional regulator
MFDYVASCGDAVLLATTLEMAAAMLAQLGESLRAARLTGAAQGIRQRVGVPIQEPEMLEGFLAPARATVAPEEWLAELAAGRGVTQPEAAALLVASGPALIKRA